MTVSVHWKKPCEFANLLVSAGSSLFYTGCHISILWSCDFCNSVLWKGLRSWYPRQLWHYHSEAASMNHPSQYATCLVDTSCAALRTQPCFLVSEFVSTGSIRAAPLCVWTLQTLAEVRIAIQSVAVAVPASRSVISRGLEAGGFWCVGFWCPKGRRAETCSCCSGLCHRLPCRGSANQHPTYLPIDLQQGSYYHTHTTYAHRSNVRVLPSSDSTSCILSGKVSGKSSECEKSEVFNHFTIFSYIFTISASIEASEVLLQNLFRDWLAYIQSYGTGEG